MFNRGIYQQVQDLSSLFDQADKLLFGKIESAKQDIHETLDVLETSKHKSDEANLLEKHIDVMNEYVTELHSQRRELRNEYMAELVKLRPSD